MSVRILVLACLTYPTHADADVTDLDAIMVTNVSPKRSSRRALSSLLYYSTLPSQRSSGGTFRNRRTDYLSDYGPSYRDGMVGTNRYGRLQGRGYPADYDRSGYNSGRYSPGMGYNRGHYGGGMDYNRGHYGAGMSYNREHYGAGMGYNRGRYGAEMDYNRGYNRNHHGAGMGYNRGHYGGSSRMGHDRGHYSGAGHYDQPYEHSDHLSYGHGDHHWADDY